MREKVIEYETVEKEEEVVWCDYCEKRANDRTIPMGVNPRRRGKAEINYLADLGVIEKDDDPWIKCDASVDICYSCAAELFDVEVGENDEVLDVKIEDGDVEVTVEKEVVRDYPTINFDISGIIAYTIFAILSPVFVGFAIMDMVEGEVDSEEIRVVGFMGLGMLVWGIFLTLFLFSLF